METSKLLSIISITPMKGGAEGCTICMLDNSSLNQTIKRFVNDKFQPCV